MDTGSRFIYDGESNESSNVRRRGSMSSTMSDFSEDFFEPGRLISLLQRHVWSIVVCIGLSVSATYYVVDNFVLPMYQSSGTIIISAGESALPGSGGADGEGVGSIISRSFTFNYGNPVQSAIYLFESRELSKIVADRLLALGGASPARQFPSLWEVFPEDSSLASVETLTSRIRRGLKIQAIEPGRNQMMPNLVEVSYQSYSPEEAAKVVNLALDAFQEKSLEQKQQTASKALSFLQKKKQETRSQLNNAEDQLVSFRNANKLVAIDAQATNSVNTLSQIQAEKQNLEIQLESVNVSIQNYERQLEAIKPGMADQYSKAIGPTITNYQQRLAELRTRRFVILSNNPQLKENPNSEPEVKKLNHQISELEDEIQTLSEGLIDETDGYLEFSVAGDGNLAQELANIQRNLIQLRIEKNQYESQVQVLNQRIQEAQSFINTYPDKQVKLARLETEVQRHKQLLDNIISQESEIALWQQTQNSSGTIVDQANPRFAPVKPNKIIWLGLAAMIGFSIPIGVFIVKESFSTVINSSEQLASYPYPLLAVVYNHLPVRTNRGILNKNGKQSNISSNLVFHNNIDTPVAESYRKISSHILYADSHTIPHTLVITSSGQGEGKTTLTGNLGAAFAEFDNKVLIIDCDFRRPALHKLFSLDNAPGIKEVLLDGAKLSEVIRETGIPNLRVLPSGVKPGSPTKLLSSRKFKEMINVLSPSYDIILFDTPPQGVVADTTSLLNLTDLVIVAAKFGTTKQLVLQHTLDDLITYGTDIGLVLTGYQPSKSYDSYDTKDLHKYMYQQYYEYEKVEKD